MQDPKDANQEMETEMDNNTPVGIGKSKFTFDITVLGGISATLGAAAPIFWAVLGGYLVDGVTPEAAVDQTFRTLNDALTPTVTRRIQTYVGNVAA